MFKITNLPEFNEQIRTWVEGAEGYANDNLRGLVSVAFKHIVTRGPQYSGDFVANTRIGVGTPDTTFHEYAVFVKGKPWHENATPAVTYAMAGARAVLPKVSLNDQIYISTTVQHKGDFYAFKVENGVVKFRPENPTAARSGGGIYAGTRDYLDNRYGILSGGILSKIKVAI